MLKLQIGLLGLFCSLWLSGCTLGQEITITIRSGPAVSANLAPCGDATPAALSQSTVVSGTLPLTPTIPITGSATLTATVTATQTAPLSGTVPVSATVTLTPTGDAPTSVPSRTGMSTVLPTPQPGSVTPAPTHNATLIPTNTQPPTATSAASNTPTPSPTRTPTPSPTPTGPTPTTTPTATPGGTVFIRSERDFRQDSTLIVVGEVVNSSAATVYRVLVTGKFYNSNDQVLATQETVAFLAQTAPDQRNPFRLEVADASPDIMRYELDVQWDEISVVSFQDLAVLSQEVRENNGPEVAGDVKNDFTENLGSIIVAVALYDEAGAIVDAYQSTPRATQLAPGDTSTYAVPITTDQPYASISVQSQGKRAIFF